MPAQPVQPTFEPLTNPRIAFANVAAFNDFIASISFTITGANIPTPTATTLGGVMSLEIGGFAPLAGVAKYENLTVDDGGTQVEIPIRESYDSLVNRIAALEAYIAALAAQLAAKGYTAI